MDMLAAMSVFVRVAEAGSFSAAARQLRVGQPAVSKSVAALEERLGTRLVLRTTHQLSLTEDGLRFLEAARGALDAAAFAEETVSGVKTVPHGRLRLAASVAFGRLILVPRLNRFFARCPDVEFELVLADRFVNLVEEGVDVAIRIGELTDAGLIARRIGTMRRVTVARTDYWKKRGTPKKPADLKDHDCLVFTGLSTADTWEYSGPNGPLSVKVCGPLRVTTSDAMREAVLEGLGVGVTPRWFWPNGELGDGTLACALSDFEPTPRPIHAIFPERRLVSSKVRAMVDFLADDFKRVPALSEG
ncbi:MAG: LysR family transcriptional regulator [Pseudomonadota bacterium]